MKLLLYRLKTRIIYQFSKYLRPEMIGYTFWNNRKVRNCRISNAAHVSHHANIFLGDNIFIFHNTYLDGFCKITLEDGVAIGHCSTLVTHSTHQSLRLYGDAYLDTPVEKMKGLFSGEIKIGAYTFVGPNCVIMPGTTIGKGCIVAAFSFVSGNFPDYSVIKGNPATVVGNTRDTDLQFLKRYPELNHTYYDRDHL